jgi:hypothetical protein
MWAVLVMMEKEEGCDMFQGRCPGNSLNRLINQSYDISKRTAGNSILRHNFMSCLYNSIPGIGGYAVVSTSKHQLLVSHRCDTETCHEPFYTLSKVPLNDIKVLMAEIMKYADLWYVTAWFVKNIPALHVRPMNVEAAQAS